MSPEQQRIKIAEACGWRHINSEMWHGNMGCHTVRLMIPDYLNDLNAMHEAEKVLLKRLDHWWDYAYMLRELKVCQQYGTDGILHATAEQRAEAFLKTLNLWEDEQ